MTSQPGLLSLLRPATPALPSSLDPACLLAKTSAVHFPNCHAELPWRSGSPVASRQKTGRAWVSCCCSKTFATRSGSMSSLTPSIRISQPPRYHSPPNCSTYGPAAAAAPVASSHMAIPRTREKSAPPPLPPPSHFVDLSTAQDPGWQWGNGPEGSDFGGRAAAVKPGSGLVRGGGGGGDDDVKGHRQEKEHDFTPHRAMNETRRGSSISTVTLNRDHDMTEDRLAHSDEDGNPSRPLSNYRYVFACDSTPVERDVFERLTIID